MTPVPAVGTTPPAADAERLEKATLADVNAALESSDEGLTSSDAQARISTYGRNVLEEKSVSSLRQFLAYFWGPIPWMIELAALLSVAIGHWADFSIIMVLLLYNAISGVWQERKAADAMEKRTRCQTSW